jgi:four helix bundle protein
MELCEVVSQMTTDGLAAADLEFRDQIRRAADSAPSLIAEGFLRFTTGEFVRYLRMARGELGEVQSLLERARRKKYFADDVLDGTCLLARRAIGTTTNLLKAKIQQQEAERRQKRRRPRKRQRP